MDLKGNKEAISYPKGGAMKRAFSGSLFTVMGEVIGAVRHILLIPLFLRAWGRDVYGEWLAIYALVAYLPLVDIGMHNYVVNSLTQYRSKADCLSYTKVLHSALRLYLMIVILFTLILAAFIYLTPFDKWVNISITAVNEVKAATFLLGMYILLSVPGGLVSGLYHSLAEFPRRAILTNIQQILLLSFLATVLFLKYNFVVVALVHFVPFLIILIFTVYDISHRYPEVNFGFSSGDWRLSLSLLSPGFFFFFIALSNLLKIQGSILVVSASIGAAAAAVFSVHRTLANLIIKITGAIRNAVWPEVTVTDATDNYAKMSLLHNFLMKILLLISTSFAAFLCFTGKDIINLWTNGRIEFQPVLWMLLVAYLPINCLWETSGLFQFSTNKHRRFSLCKSSSSMLGIVLCVLLTKIWGIVGTLSGFVIAELAICWIIPLETLRIVKIKRADFLVNIVAKGALIAGLQVLFGWFASSYISNIFIRYLVLIIVILAVGLSATYFLWFTQEERVLTFGLIKRLKR